MTNYEIALYDELIELNIATEEEINLARCLVSGSWEEVLNKIIYARTGYHDLEQFKQYEWDEE